MGIRWIDNPRTKSCQCISDNQNTLNKNTVLGSTHDTPRFKLNNERA